MSARTKIVKTGIPMGKLTGYMVRNVDCNVKTGFPTGKAAYGRAVKLFNRISSCGADAQLFRVYQFGMKCVADCIQG